MKRVGVLLITLALITGPAGCSAIPPADDEPTPPIQYSLTISSTQGGLVITPGEGVFTYDVGAVVNVIAVADEGCQFDGWGGDVGGIADLNAKATTVTMAHNCSITAHFSLMVPVVEVRTWYDLDAVRDNLAGHYVLANNMDGTVDGYEDLASSTADNGRGWKPIGDLEHPFVGRFDGQGHEIRNVHINRPNDDWVGLLGALDDGGVVANLGMTSVSVVGGSAVGALVGRSYSGAVVNCYSADGIVVGRSSVGALVGLNALGSSVDSCYSTGDVTGVIGVGGLVGINRGCVSSSYSGCSVTGERDVGGLVGVVWVEESLVTHCYSTGNVTGYAVVGGLVGRNYVGTVTHCYSTGAVTGSLFVGGLVGETQTYSDRGIVISSFWDRQTSGMEVSDGGTGKTTAEMKSITTFSSSWWSISSVAFGQRNAAHVWNIVDGQTYPFLSWQQVP